MSHFIIAGDNENIIPEKKLSEKVIRVATNKAINATKNAHVAISNHRVGACVIAYPDTASNQYRLFTGCNIELATSIVYHAERVALVKAISEGYPVIDTCVVTSSHNDQQAAMCGYCMQDFMYANPTCRIIVVDMLGRVKINTTVLKRNGKYAYLGKGKLQI